MSGTASELHQRLLDFCESEIVPAEEDVLRELADGERWAPLGTIEALKTKARAAGLWNLFLPDSEHGSGLSNREYAPLAEAMGLNEWAPEVFNCNAPDSGNMEILHGFGTEDQKKRWLEPLLAGETRSCFSMTEPDVASSDATNVRTSATLENGHWIINGRKWWVTGGGDRRCEFTIVMCVTNPDESRHGRHSQIIVPMDAEGLTIEKRLDVFGYDHAPGGHVQISFNNVRVPEENVIGGAGRGFTIAQARLGPGRIHHCMRSIGMAERAFELMCRRSVSRVAFGKPLARLGGNAERIARSRIEIDNARLLVLDAAEKLDQLGPKGAATAISAIKVVAPNMACRVIDRAIQMHGGAGVGDDLPLAAMYAGQRTLRIADGPDEVHLASIAKRELRKYEENG